MLLAVNLATFEIFKENNIDFHAVAGFSLGKYAALVAAYFINVKTAFELVNARAMAMETEIEDDAGKMIAIFNMNIEQIESICESLGNSEAVISNYNSYNKIGVSCTTSRFDELVYEVKSAGGKTIQLTVNRLFHHPVMRPVAEEFRKTLDRIDFKNPIVPIYLNVSGDVLTSAALLTQNLYEQIFKPVQWIKIIEGVLNDGIVVFYEINPKSVLKTLVNNIASKNSKTLNAIYFCDRDYIGI